MMPASNRRAILAAAALALTLGAIGATAASAQEAHVTFTPEAPLWREVVQAHIQGTGCSGQTAVPAINMQQGTIDIDLLGCSAASTAAFSAVVSFGPLYPQEYAVRLLDGSRQGKPQIGAAVHLKVYPEGSIDVELPAAPTDAASFPITFLAPASSSCVFFDGPTVHGNVIEASFDDFCPIIPFGGPQIFRREVQVGPLPAGEYEVRFFLLNPRLFFTPALHRETFVVYPAAGCLPSDTALCLQGGRFRVEAAWQDFAGHEGMGHPIALSQGDGASGLLWFFSPDNVELTVKVLDACALGGHFWVFLSSSTTVHYTVTVTDTQTGAHRTYSQEAGKQSPLTADTSAFDCAAP
jgi:hypothetical protein